MSHAIDFAGITRVRLTDEARGMGLQGKATSPYGLVVAWQPPFRIKVLRDGLKTANWYHCDLWLPNEAL